MMYFVGIDDTDTIDSRGTNKLALQIIDEFAESWECHQLLRHQLFVDDRIPFTSKNGSASLLFSPRNGQSCDDLFQSLREIMLRELIPGSDPGLAICEDVAGCVVEFGRQCQTEVCTQEQAVTIAQAAKVRLEGLGGTNDGIIGALAAIGLARTENDGRIIYLRGWTEQLEGKQRIEVLREMNVSVMCGDRELESGWVTLHKKLRPNRRNGRNILYVSETPEGLQALKLL